MSGAVPGTKAEPGDPVDICVCGHVADWHYQLTPEGRPMYGRPDGSRTRCPNYYCACRELRRDTVRPLARIPAQRSVLRRGWDEAP